MKGTTSSRWADRPWPWTSGPRPTFEVMFVPVRQSVNNLVGDVTAGNASQFMDVTIRMLPIAQADVGRPRAST